MTPTTSADARTMMTYDVHKKSEIAAYILWFFVGLFGGHRFYLGRYGSAVGMALLHAASFVLSFVLIGFVGYAALGTWWLVDAFLIPGMIRGHNLRLANRLSL